MRCYFVLVDCRLTWPLAQSELDVEQPAGLMGHRFVLASDEQSAAAKAVYQIKADVAKKFGWDGSINPIAEWSAEEVQNAPFFDFLKRKWGYTFYAEE